MLQMTFGHSGKRKENDLCLVSSIATFVWPSDQSFGSQVVQIRSMTERYVCQIYDNIWARIQAYVMGTCVLAVRSGPPLDSDSLLYLGKV